jgi:arachidonate 15-lipoxygenase
VFYLEGTRLYRASPRPHGHAGEEKFVGARREVILAGGAFNSPQLLMLSGIGDSAHLAEHRISPVKHLPGVGRNLQDRYEIGVVNRVRRPWKALRGANYSTGDSQYRKWRWFRIGAYTSNGLLFSVMFPSRTNVTRPDLFCFLLLADFRGYYPGYSERIKKRDYLTWVVLKAYTQNTAGTVRLRSENALDRPDINFRYFGEGSCPRSDDVDAVVTGIRFGREVADAIGHKLFAEEEVPGRHLFTDDQLKQHVEENAWGHHACGTCAMKPEDQCGVVDSRFRVHGIPNLRVVDASIFPRIPGYFIVTSVYMIAEKAADVLLADAELMSPSGRSSTMQPCLPQNDPNSQSRRQTLEARRKEYFFNYTYIPGYPFLDHVPKREKFSLRYWAGRFVSLALLPFNVVFGHLRTALINPVANLSDFLNLYTLYRRPENIEAWLSDDGFAEQRICGCNPQAIRRLDQLPADFPFSDAQLQAAAGDGHTLAVEAAAGTLYLADFDALAHIKGSDYKGRHRTIPAPRALFWWNRADEKLHSVGVQVRREAGSRVFTPSDPLLDWTAAKMAYQCADGCHQEIGSHFAWSHMVMAPVAVVTRRQLAEQHPVHALLIPHFRFYLYDNELGRVAFINPGGPVERMLGGTLLESLGIPLNLYKKWNIRDFGLPAELAGRGLADAQPLTRYPMRDDGLPVWHAIDEFVGGYLRIYYKTDGDVAADPEIQAWARELASRDIEQNGGCIAGMPERIDSIGLLRELLTTVIWTCGPLHSMLNFSQWDYINLPNMSYAIYAEVPEEVGATTYNTLMSMMPPFRQASYQLWWCKILTSYKYDKLGDYLGQFSAPEAQLVVQMFQQRLQVIEKEIEARDNARVMSFPYLKPSLCINSINT